MATSTIAVNADTDEVTLINVFTVEPQRQTELFEPLDRATDETFAGTPGFISANLHVSLDGHRVVNYVQWASMPDYEKAMARPEVREHVLVTAAIAQSYQPTCAKVRAVHHRAD